MTGRKCCYFLNMKSGPLTDEKSNIYIFFNLQTAKLAYKREFHGEKHNLLSMPSK